MPFSVLTRIRADRSPAARSCALTFIVIALSVNLALSLGTSGDTGVSDGRLIGGAPSIANGTLFASPLAAALPRAASNPTVPRQISLTSFISVSYRASEGTRNTAAYIAAARGALPYLTLHKTGIRLSIGPIPHAVTASRIALGSFNTAQNACHAAMLSHPVTHARH